MKRWISFSALLAVGLGALIYCQMRRVQTPVSPAPILYFIADSEHELTRLPVRFAPLSDADEIRIGDQLARIYVDGWPTSRAETASDDRTVRLYVEQQGARVAAHAHRKLPYKFHYISDMNFINAFALPGGHVYIGAGLISLMDSEDELAAVLGHEVEHIDHYHCAEREQTEEALGHVPLGALAAIPVEIFEAGYSKDQELEADREGTRLAALAGYSPLGAIRMFDTLDHLEHMQTSPAQTPQQELSRMADQMLEGYFRSHPEPQERIAQIKRMVTEGSWTNMPAERNLAVAFIFLTRRAKRALEAGDFKGGVTLAAQSLGEKPDQPEALAVMAEARFALGDYTGSATAYGKVREVSLRDAASIVDFAAGRAKAALASSMYGKAVILAQETLKLEPGNPEALGVLGDAEFAQADFHAAAGAYRKLLESSPTESSRVVDYATALSAEGAPQTASAAFDSWLKALHSPPIAVVSRARVESAGLELLAGNSVPLDRTLAQARAAGVSALDPDLLARLGWWCYRAEKYSEAADFLNTAALGSGNHADGLDTLGWIEIEQDHPDAAARIFSDPMGKAVARWQDHTPDEALKNFSTAVRAKPEWLNPQWVKALHTTRVERSIMEMQAERTRRDRHGIR